MPISIFGAVLAPLFSIVAFLLAPYIGMGSMGQAATRSKVSREKDISDVSLLKAQILQLWNSLQASFLDVVSINQADADLKERGIYGTLLPKISIQGAKKIDLGLVPNSHRLWV